jgi:membrane protein implicated in regulation of membrane protease activity
MDPTLVSEQPGGLYGWIMQYGQVVAFVAQMIYWLAMIVLLAYAVVQYKRWVNYQMGVGKSGKLRKAEEAGAGKETKAVGAAKPGSKGVSVDEFVE